MYTALATTADVQAYYIGLVFDTGTEPTKVEVENWIDEATSIVYGKLANNYTVPFTDTADLALLKSLVTRYTIDRVNFVLSRNSIMVPSTGQLVPRGFSDKGFFELLNSIASGDYKLASPMTNYASMPFSYNVDNEIECVGKKDEEQW